jgi:hypothetical protein
MPNIRSIITGPCTHESYTCVIYSGGGGGGEHHWMCAPTSPFFRATRLRSSVRGTLHLIPHIFWILKWTGPDSVSLNDFIIRPRSAGSIWILTPQHEKSVVPEHTCRVVDPDSVCVYEHNWVAAQNGSRNIKVADVAPEFAPCQLSKLSATRARERARFSSGKSALHANSHLFIWDIQMRGAAAGANFSLSHLHKLALKWI